MPQIVTLRRDSASLDTLAYRAFIKSLRRQSNQPASREVGPPVVDHPLVAKRAEVDQKVLANLLALNHARAKGATL